MIVSQAGDRKAAKPGLTRAEILRVAGDIGDAKVAAIEASGARLEELEEAVAWAAGESDVMGELRLPLVGRTSALYDILTADEAYGDERD
jgi:hypothetical protein